MGSLYKTVQVNILVSKTLDTMDILESCNAIRKKLSKSGLHYLIHETPFSLLIKIKKKRIGENDSKEDELISERYSSEDDIQKLKAQIQVLEKEMKNIHSSLRQYLTTKKENMREEDKGMKEKEYKLNNMTSARKKESFNNNLNENNSLNEPGQKIKESMYLKSRVYTNENIVHKLKNDLHSNQHE